MALRKEGVQARLGVEKAFEVLSSALPGFEYRKEQYRLTEEIARSIYYGQNLVAQAPTGTGKSFAVGLGLAAELLGSTKKAIIATANNNLLEQYCTKDFPFLAKIFPGLRWTRAKGKNNYACVDKSSRLFNQQVLWGQDEKLNRLQQWYNQTRTGDKDEITFPLDANSWSKINVDDTCTGRRCPFFADCHYYLAKSEIASAQVIITNFDLLLLDLLNPELQIFPNYDVLIIDEAHELEDKAIGKMEQSLTFRQVTDYWLEAVQRYGLAESETMKRNIHDSIRKFFEEHGKLLTTGEERKTITPRDELVAATNEFLSAMVSLRSEVAKFQTEPDSRARKAQENLMDKIAAAGRAAQAAITPHPLYVSWMETHKGDTKIVTCPFRIAGKLNKILFSDAEKTVICLSATLGAVTKSKVRFSANGDELPPEPKFEWFRKRVGLLTAFEFDCPSPFNYAKNCVLYLPKAPEDCQNPNDKNGHWRFWMKDQIVQLLALSQGRAFILTTSSAASREIGEFINKMVEFPVKTQGVLSNNQLIEWFKATPKSVLVGTASFWQGVSIEGDALKLVIIDKIPFTSQYDPIQQARDAWYKADPTRKAKAFLDLGIQPAIIKLNQGFGRLIRTSTDRGAVAILDPRLTAKPFGKQILRALPKAVQVKNIDDPRLINILK